MQNNCTFLLVFMKCAALTPDADTSLILQPFHLIFHRSYDHVALIWVFQKRFHLLLLISNAALKVLIKSFLSVWSVWIYISKSGLWLSLTLIYYPAATSAEIDIYTLVRSRDLTYKMYFWLYYCNQWKNKNHFYHNYLLNLLQSTGLFTGGTPILNLCGSIIRRHYVFKAVTVWFSLVD